MTQVPQESAPAPVIEGYTYVRPIGSGGFSDVYLYTQQMPRREVAIKVLRTDDLSPEVREQFADEANMMARVSNHSNIAAIYAADVDDDGQPYLVMEYCSGGSLGRFYRHYPMAVKEVLSIGVRLAGALAAAHRAGIVHRDVKPANILLTEYGVPVLADFGISTIDDDYPGTTRVVRTGERPGTGESSVGMSLPWAAPETLWDDPVSDALSDGYSFAATLFSLLEGRSPHEVPGGPNSAVHLSGRIRTGFIGAMKRPDVPESLRQLLRTGMAHDRAGRFRSMVEMGRALQQIQRELGYEVTPLEVPRGAAPSRPPRSTQQVRQSEPIQLPPGHATLAPGDDPAAALSAASDGPAPQSPSPQSTGRGPAAPHPGSSVPHHGQTATVQPVAPAPAPQNLPQATAAVYPQTTSHTPAPPAAKDRSSWSRGLAAVVGVLVVACAIVGGLLIADLTGGPAFEGHAVEHIETAQTSTGIYHVTIPDGLEVPETVGSRVLATGDGDTLASTRRVQISLHSTSWVTDTVISLNPMESANVDGVIALDTADLSQTLALDAAALHIGDDVLVAAPEGYFSNTHPEMTITASDQTVVVLTILDAY